MLVFREVLDPKYGMFKNYDETRTIWFSEVSFEDELMYFLIGMYQFFINFVKRHKSKYASVDKYFCRILGNPNLQGYELQISTAPPAQIGG